MEKLALDPQKLYYSIGEVCKLIGVEASTLRYWEKEFTQLRPKRSSRGRRQYTHENIEIIQQIYHLVRIEGISLEVAKKRISELTPQENIKIELAARLHRIRHMLNELKDCL